MSLPIHPILFRKPNRAQYSLEINPEKQEILERSSQNAYYLDQLKKTGIAPGYQLRSVPFETGHKSSYKYQLQSFAPPFEIIEGSRLNGVYAFVILEEAGKLTLRLGKMSHWFVAKKARYVKAAGDLEFLQGEIVKVTDQSGGYCVDNRDPDREAKKASLRAHMKAAGLPMDKFKPFMEPVKPASSHPLLFNQPLKPASHKRKEKTRSAEFSV